MSSNVINQIPYLRTSREFPREISELCQQIDKSYVDIANAVNQRTIGLFPSNRPAITGESYFIYKNERQQSLRQVYTFTNTATISTTIRYNSVRFFSKPSGSFTDGTNYYGLLYASNVAIAGQISFYLQPSPALNPTTYNIVFLSGAGAPTLSSGLIILEWLTNV